MNSFVFVMCQTKEEVCQHLLIDCVYAQRVWSLCFKWLGIMFVQHFDLKTHFMSFHLSQSSSKQDLV